MLVLITINLLIINILMPTIFQNTDFTSRGKLHFVFLIIRDLMPIKDVYCISQRTSTYSFQ